MLNKGWFIPAIIAGAAACTVAFWCYLNTSTSEPIAARYRLPTAHQKSTDTHSSKSYSSTSPPAATLSRIKANGDSTQPNTRASESTADPTGIAMRDVFAGPPKSKNAIATRGASESASVETASAEKSDNTITRILPDAAPSLEAATAPPASVAASNSDLKAPGALRPLKDRIARYLMTRLDDLDFLAMELDRNALRWRSGFSRDPWIITMAAWLQYNAGEVEDADRSFTRAISIRPDCLFALRGRALANMEAGRFAQAVSAFHDLCRAYPKDAEAHYNHGVLLTRVGRLGEAEDAYRAAIAIEPQHARSIYNLAAIAQHDGRLADARRLWEQFTEIEPNVISVWFNLGVVHMDYNEPLNAARCFEAAVSINPEEIVGRINLALAYMEAGHLEAAELTLETANTDAPCTPAVLDALVETNRRLAVWSKADRFTYLARAESIEIELFDMRPTDMVFERVAGDPTKGEAAGLSGP